VVVAVVAVVAVVSVSDGLVVEVDVSVGAVGKLTLAVLLVICVSVFEMLLAMLDAPPEPQPAVTRPTRTAAVTFSRNERASGIWLNAKAIRHTGDIAAAHSPR